MPYHVSTLLGSNIVHAEAYMTRKEAEEEAERKALELAADNLRLQISPVSSQATTLHRSSRRPGRRFSHQVSSESGVERIALGKERLAGAHSEQGDTASAIEPWTCLGGS